MRRCTRSSILLACHRPSRSRFKAWNGGFHRQHEGHHQNIEQKASRSQKGAPALNGGFQGQAEAQPQHHRSSKGKSKRPPGQRSSSQQGRRQGTARSPGSSGSSSSGESSDSESSRSSAPEPGSSCCGGDKRWHARRRDPRVNGADIYVARFTKNGMGSASPCWRCLEWCRWAGVKRIFHWNGDEGKFDVVKVNSAQGNIMYETHADFRLFAGLVG